MRGTAGTTRESHHHLSLPNEPVEAEDEGHRLPDAEVERKTARTPTVGNVTPTSETFRLGEATGCT